MLEREGTRFGGVEDQALVPVGELEDLVVQLEEPGDGTGAFVPIKPVS